MQDSKYITMTTASLKPLIIKLALPSVVIMLVSAMYNLSATYYVSRLGVKAVAAIGVSFSFQAILQAIGFFFGQGSGNYISRVLGAKNKHEAKTMAATGVASAFIMGVVLAIIASFTLRSIAISLGATNAILQYTIEYMRFIVIGSPFIICTFTMNNLLRFQGAATLSMIGIVSGAILNIGLTPLFMFKYNMGISGAGISTFISQVFSFALLFIIIQKNKYCVKLRLKNIRPTKSSYKEITRGGLPSLIRQAVGSIAILTMNHAAGFYGETIIAAMSIVNRVTMIIAFTIIGIGQGYQPVCGFCYGAKIFSRVKEGFWFCTRLSSILLVAASIACYIFAPEIINIFSKGEGAAEVLKVGIIALRMQCFSLPLTAFITISNMMMQTCGKAVPASIIALARQGLFLIPILFIFNSAFGVLGIQISTPVADVMTFILTIPFCKKILKEIS